MKEKHNYSIKVINVDKKNIEEKIRRAGGRLIVENALTRTLVFDHPALKIKSHGKILRLRQVGKRIFLSIRAAAENAPTSPFHKIQESEVSVDDFRQAFQMLESLGFNAFRYHEKLKDCYGYGNVSVEINQFPTIKPYIEIKGEEEKSIIDFLTKLGYTISDTVKISATQILRESGLKDVDIIRFPNSKEGI